MVFRRNFVVVLLSFCICSVMFVALPIKSQVSPVYDPWADVSGIIVGQPDGVINMRDIAYEVSLFNTYGTPIDRAQVNNGLVLEQLLKQPFWINYSEWYNGLVGYWKLDEGTGNTTTDSSGTGNNGTLINGPAWVDGKYGKALAVNGTNYVSVPDSPTLQFQNFSLEAWVYMTEEPQQNVFGSIIRRFGTDVEMSAIGYWLGFYEGNLQLIIGYGLQGGVTLVQLPQSTLTLNEWHQVVATFDGSTATLYIDGLAKASYSWTLFARQYYISSPLLLGAYMSNSTIDSAMVYNRSLSATEVMLHYLVPPP